MKKISIILLAAIMALSCVACNKTTDTQSSESSSVEDTVTVDDSTVQLESDWFTVRGNVFESNLFGLGIKMNPEWIITSNEIFSVYVLEKSGDIEPIITMRMYEQGDTLMKLVSSWEERTIGGVTFKYFVDDTTINLVTYDEASKSALRIDLEEYIFIDLQNNFYQISK